MLSRVAERIYWLARYIERAENTARIVNVNANLLMDLPKKLTLGWQPLIEITGCKKLYQKRYQNFNETNVVRFLVADLKNPGSLRSSVQAARENARTIRDIIPRDGWEHINNLHLRINEALPSQLSKARRFDFFGQVISATQQLTGLLAGTMPHDFGYDFLRMGRNLERADMTTRIVDVRSKDLFAEDTADLVPYENIQWMSVLNSLSAYQSYRQKMHVGVSRREVVNFLLNDVEFPRAFHHCINEVQDCLSHLPRNKAPQQQLTALRQELRESGPQEMKPKKLHRFIDHMQGVLGQLHNEINNTYFAY